MSDTQTVVPVSPEEKSAAIEKATAHLQNTENKTTNERGRPTVITPERVVLLITAFQNGLNVRSACVYAGISKDAYYKKYNEEPEFADTIDLAKNNLVQKAGNAISAILGDPNNRDQGKMARWVFEKKLPEDYGQKTTPQNPIGQQNNFYVLNKNELSDITKQPDINAADPSELFEALEKAPVLDSGAEETSAAQIYPSEVRDNDSNTSNMQQPQRAV